MHVTGHGRPRASALAVLLGVAFAFLTMVGPASAAGNPAPSTKQLAVNLRHGNAQARWKSYTRHQRRAVLRAVTPSTVQLSAIAHNGSSGSATGTPTTGAPTVPTVPVLPVGSARGAAPADHPYVAEPPCGTDFHQPCNPLPVQQGGPCDIDTDTNQGISNCFPVPAVTVEAGTSFPTSVAGYGTDFFPAPTSGVTLGTTERCAEKTFAVHAKGFFGLSLWYWNDDIYACTNGTNIVAYSSTPTPTIDYFMWSFGGVQANTVAGIGTPIAHSVAVGKFSLCANLLIVTVPVGCVSTHYPSIHVTILATGHYFVTGRL